MNIMLATPCGGAMNHANYTLSLITECLLNTDRLEQYKHYNILPELIFGQSGLAKDRCVIATRAMFRRMDKLIFIDSDQSWEWWQLKKLIDSDKPIIAGVVGLKEYPMPLNFSPHIKDKDCFVNEDSNTVHWDNFRRLREKYKGQDEIEVQGVGTAFLKIDTKVLYELTKSEFVLPFYYPDPQTKMDYAFDFFQTGVVQNSTQIEDWGGFPTEKLDITIPGTDIKKRIGLYFGEDWGFCTVARRAGFPIYIDSSLVIPHYGGHKYVIGNELKKGEYDQT